LLAVRTGVTKLVVVARGAPNVATSYQATVPLVGAVAVNVTEPDPQIVAPLARGAAGNTLTVIVFVTVVLHPFSTTVYDITDVPDVKPVTTPVALTVATNGDALVHVPLALVFVNTVVDPIQTPFAPAIDSTTGNGFTVIVIGFDVAGDPTKHGVAFDVINTVTTSLFVNVLVVYVALVAPTISLPLSFHWYVGVVPPFVGVAVNVTLVPAQIVLLVGLDAMITLAIMLALKASTTLIPSVVHPAVEVALM
jgi:hypothetical protein